MINIRQIRMAEECLYAYKYLHGRIVELEMVIDTMVPRSPGSVLKVVGRPVAKTPCDTSETERWGIIRASCLEARELMAKLALRKIVKQYKDNLPVRELEFVRLKYDRELPARHVKKALGLDHREYYTVRQRVLKKLWQQVNGFEKDIDLAVK